ncbi:Probable inactive receptor kinase At1g48480 [Linum grandiflorum]
MRFSREGFANILLISACLSFSQAASWSPESQPPPQDVAHGSGSGDLLEKILPVVLGIAVIVCIYFLAYSVRKRLHGMATQEKETTDLKTLAILSPQKTPSPMLQVKHEEMRSEFVFFVEEKERFDLGELLESAADLQNQTICSSLYKEALISEYGYAKYRNPKISKMFSSNGYTAPEEETVSEKGDVYSFGIILLELLTGKTVEKSGIDLPKWVRSMVREEWTGEVFDRQITNPAREYAFHLLNIALKCVSSKPEDRPTIAELVDKFDEVSNANEDVSISSMASTDHQFSPKSCCLLHSVIPEAWDTPGSNY